MSTTTDKSDNITEDVLERNPIGIGLTEALGYLIEVCSDEWLAKVLPGFFLGVTDEAVRLGREASLEMERLFQQANPGYREFAEPKILQIIEAEHFRRFST